MNDTDTAGSDLPPRARDADGPVVAGLGEALFDVFPSGPRLGGAPLNVAVHAHRLLGAAEPAGRGVVVSRVGVDDLGRRLRDELHARGLDDAFVQSDPDHPTGRVDVELDGEGGHAFHVAQESAWDFLAATPALDALAGSCSAVAFGSLAQRNPVSAATLRRFVDRVGGVGGGAVRLFDVNLRASDGRSFYDAEVLRAGCTLASLVKLNDEELGTVCSLTGVADAAGLRERFGLDAVVLTLGSEGTVALTAEAELRGEPGVFDPDGDADSVGAGDACSAGLLSALVTGHPMEHALTVANAMGAFVAGRAGATPDLPERILRLVRA
ncbi:PfkB family carbohydrate kinase [Phycisphaera mikurensis]|uniref:Putative fructokinase n=1 Tax=Phycisphaera mikurensis (strain NBRC 102666 / KCTC 22515 / FYK2301M01) TaxID=1142394 RepID=I0IBB2_PHYMF|nr:PfkB family carbohydrate kinase [Phycisphaera mikurensis]MBB6443045.1 fructokinase [Phycisphaera mikurensis]BAM02550.1 putative fructokinase [Phycisphaera mikurensis NBRC 102666]